MKSKKKIKKAYKKKLLKTLLEMNDYVECSHSELGTIKHTLLRIEEILKDEIEKKKYEINF